MKIDNVTLAVLKNFSGFTDSIFIKPGNTLKIASKNKGVCGIARVPLTIEKEFGIYSISKFLSTLSLFKDPNINFYDKYFTISDDNKTAKFYSATEDTIGKVRDIPIKTAPSVSVNINQANLTEIDKAASILGHTEIHLVGDGEFIYLQTAINSNPTGSSFSIKLGETTKKFKAIFSVDNLHIMAGNYSVDLYFPNISHFKGDNIEYYIVMADKSEFN